MFILLKSLFGRPYPSLPAVAAEHGVKTEPVVKTAAQQLLATGHRYDAARQVFVKHNLEGCFHNINHRNIYDPFLESEDYIHIYSKDLGALKQYAHCLLLQGWECALSLEFGVIFDPELGMHNTIMAWPAGGSAVTFHERDGVTLEHKRHPQLRLQ